MVNKRGQLTIFVILAIIIFVLGILLYMFYPEVSGFFGGGEENPTRFIQSCIDENDKFEKVVQTISLQGGSMNPQHYVFYKNTNIEYLCYTNEDYNTCVVQQPMLDSHIESEIEKELSDEVDVCFDKLEDSFKKRGYIVNLKRGINDVELLPDKIVFTFNNSLTLTKQDTKEYGSFVITLNNNLYELVSMANSIISSETVYGDAETTTYMNYYHDKKVEKTKLSDGTAVYVISERNTGNKFQFASRSLTWPPGYGGSGK